MKTNRKFSLILLALVILLSCARAPQQSVPEKSFVTTNALEFEKIRDSTLCVVSNSRVVGSSFFVSRDKIATNIHVVAAIDPVSAHVRRRNTTWSIRGVTAYDVKNDLVVLKISGEGVPFPLADSSTVRRGEPVSAVGYPGGRYKVMGGPIHSVRDRDQWIKMEIETAGGSSGSPVLNSEGQVIGVVAASRYAAPSNALKALLAQSASTEPLAKWLKREQISAYRYWMQANDKYAAERYGEAIVDLDKAIQLNPKFIERLYRRRAVIKFELSVSEAESKNFEKAQVLYQVVIEDFDKAIELNPDRADTYYNRGLVRFTLGDLQTANGNIEKAKRLYEAGIEDCTQAIKRNSEDTLAYHNRALGLYRLAESKEEQSDIAAVQQHYQKAIQDWTQITQLNSESAEPYINLGTVKSNLGELKTKHGDTAAAQQYYKDAIKDSTQAIKLNPEDSMAYNNRGWTRYLLGESEAAKGNMAEARKLYEEAIIDSDTGIRLDPNRPEPYHTRGAAKSALGDFEGAVDDFDRAIEIEPKPAETAYIRGLAKTYYERGLAKEALGQKEAAKADFKKAKELDPDLGK